MERKVICSVFIGQIDVRQGRHDGARRHAEYVLGEADGDIEPDSVCRNEGIRVIGCRVENQHDGKRAEPIMSGNQLLPHIGEEDKEQKIRGVDAVAERIADADVVKDIRVERCVGEIECERIRCGDQNCAEKAFVFEGKCEDIGKFCFRCGCIGEFLRNQPDHAVYDCKSEGDESDGDEHRSFLRGVFQTIADCGNCERNGKRDGAVDTACGIEIIYANVIRKKICVPGGKSGSEKLVDGVCDDDQNDEPKQKRFGIFNQHGEQGDTDDIDGIERKLARNKNPFSFFETFKDGGGEDIEQTGNIRNESQDTDLRFIQSVHQEKTRVEKTSRKLSDKP